MESENRNPAWLEELHRMTQAAAACIDSQNIAQLNDCIYSRRRLIESISGDEFRRLADGNGRSVLQDIVVMDRKISSFLQNYRDMLAEDMKKCRDRKSLRSKFLIDATNVVPNFIDRRV